MCSCNKNIYTYEKLCELRDFLKGKCRIEPRIGIICGSGLGSLGDAIDDAWRIQYTHIPDFPVSTVEGHAGRLILGRVRGVPVVCMQGRFHYYEGYPLSVCAMPVRLMKLLGIKYLIASNAAGGLNPRYKVGDVMLQKDHFNIMGLAGIGPNIGPNDPRFGPRFFSMSNAYDQAILNEVRNIVRKLGIEDKVHEGVYTCVGGPNYETVADLRGLANLGVDAVGMSTVHEVIAARQCGVKCFAFSLITNICSTEYGVGEEADSGKVLQVGTDMEKELKMLVEDIVQYIENSIVTE